jgi:hypothetical protein
MQYLHNGRGEVSLLWTTTAGAGKTGEEIPARAGSTSTRRRDRRPEDDADASRTGSRARSSRYALPRAGAWYSDGYERSTGSASRT